MSLDVLRTTAQTLIVKFGKVMTLQHTVEGAYDPLTGVAGADTITSYVVHGTPPQAASFTQQPGSLIQAGDLMTTLPAVELETHGVDLGRETEAAFSLVVDGVPWRLVEKRPLYLQSQIGMWEVVLRL